MVSRDTKLQVVAVGLGFGLLAVWVALRDGTGWSAAEVHPIDLLFVFGWYFVIFAGAHVYLATRGEGGMVPVAARWRFVAVVALSLALFAIAAVLTQMDAVAGIRPELPVFASILALWTGYVLYEAREGYLESRRGASN